MQQREADRKWKHQNWQKQAATYDAYRVTNRQPSSTRSWLKPHPPINKLAIVMALSQQLLAQKVSPPENGAV